jgi:ketosteroid isomerase-like protein
MQHEQTVSDMVDEVLVRQARARAARTGENLEEALAAILETEAGRQLSRLREGPHRTARASDWQEEIARAREEERVEYEIDAHE